MGSDERLLVRVMCAVREFDFLKRLAGMVEMEKQKVAGSLENQLVVIEAMKKELVMFVANGGLDLEKTGTLWDVIEHLNTILDIEKNRKACVGVN